MLSISTKSIEDATVEVSVLKALTILIFRTLPDEQKASIIESFEDVKVHTDPETSELTQRVADASKNLAKILREVN